MLLILLFFNENQNKRIFFNLMLLIGVFLNFTLNFQKVVFFSLFFLKSNLLNVNISTFLNHYIFKQSYLYHNLDMVQYLIYLLNTP